ncbi:MAG: YkgJ family cysteine cluster protein [Bryobacteraceae bacterium]|nr:YkgJ family cysteine cluster protein [Bryobacteraceae bacterium]
MNGLRFQCQPDCAKCCEMEGYVYLSEDDVTRIAAYLQLPQAAFEERYVYRTRLSRRLRKPGGGKQCGFLEGKQCRIHAVKPVQCRLFPFWPELVESRAEWQKTGDWCPGIGQGPLIQITTAVEVADEMRRAYPDTYSRSV